MQYKDKRYAGYYNVGPDDEGCYKTGDLVDLFCKTWGENIKWINRPDNGLHEANFLKLDCSKLKNTFEWRPHWNIQTAVEKTIEWSKCWLNNTDVRACMDKQIEDFLK